jgi:hypothetical protein
VLLSAMLFAAVFLQAGARGQGNRHKEGYRKH